VPSTVELAHLKNYLMQRGKFNKLNKSSRKWVKPADVKDKAKVIVNMFHELGNELRTAFQLEVAPELSKLPNFGCT
jgi:hypothetical protein